MQDFDTGSADLWVPGTGVSGFDSYNPDLSSTAQNTSDSFYITYGDGTGVTGPVYTDTVTVAGISAEQQHFAATKVGIDFSDTGISGIAGMAFEALSNIGERPFFQTMFEEGKVQENLFSFTLGDAADGELFLGGIDSSKISGGITYTPVVHQGCTFLPVSPTGYQSSLTPCANRLAGSRDALCRRRRRSR